MQILLCAATPFEISAAEAFIKEKHLPVSLLITGVGLTAATYSITRAVHIFRPTLLLQAGIGGTFSDTYPLGTTVAVRSECIGDLGVEEGGKFISIAGIGLQDSDGFPWKNGKLPADPELLARTGLPLANSVSVNEISTRPDRIRYYKALSGGGIESMEGAALHYVGLMEKIPFIQVRSLSNFAGERDKSRWKMQEAIGQLNLDLQIILTKLMEP